MRPMAMNEARYDPLELLTIPQVAALAKVTPRTVYRWIAAGELRVVHLGRLTRIPRVEAERFIADQLDANVPPPTPLHRRQS